MKKGLIIGIIVVVVLVGALEIYLTINKNSKDSYAEIEEVSNDGEYYLTYNDVELKIDEVFTEDLIDEEYAYSEIPSCAFEGVDKVYTYENIEITTYEDGDSDKIYSIYFLNSEITTNEGLRISDDYNAMISIYGTNYVNNGNGYSYKVGDTSLDIVIENEIVTSIQYTLITD